MTAATPVRIQPGDFRVRTPRPPELMAKTRPRLTDAELEEKLATCKTQYSRQIQENAPKDLQLVTLGQIGALQMVLGYQPDGKLPLVCIM